MNSVNNASIELVLDGNCTSSQIIIPYNFFKGQYPDVLFALAKQGHITLSEQRLLKELSWFAYKDGQCTPRQKTLAKRLGLTTRQIRKILSSLKKKQLIHVHVKSSRMFKLSDRFRGNEYFFLAHPLYQPFLTILPKELPKELTKELNVRVPWQVPWQSSGYTYYKETKVYKTPSGPSGASLKKETFDDTLVCKIQDRCHGVHRFNVNVFIKKYKKSYPIQSIQQTLDAVWAAMKRTSDNLIFRLTEWWGYAIQTLKRIGGNMNEQQSIKDSQVYKNMTMPDQLTALAADVSNANTDNTKQRCPDDNTNSDIIVQIENRCRNLNRFNIQAFVSKYQKIYPPEVLKVTIDAIWQKMHTCTCDEIFKVMEWWKYGEQIATKISCGINEHQGGVGTAQTIQFPAKVCVSKHKSPDQSIKKVSQKHQNKASCKPCRVSPKQDIQPSGLVAIDDINALDKFIKKQNLNNFEKTRIKQGKMHALRQAYIKLFCKQIKGYLI